MLLKARITRYCVPKLRLLTLVSSNYRRLNRRHSFETRCSRVCFCNTALIGNDSDAERSARSVGQRQHELRPVSGGEALPPRRLAVAASIPRLVVRQLHGAPAVAVEPHHALPTSWPLRRLRRPVGGALERPRRRSPRHGPTPRPDRRRAAPAAVRHPRRRTPRRQSGGPAGARLRRSAPSQPGADGRHRVANPIPVHVSHLQYRLLAILPLLLRTLVVGFGTDY